jgi:hypothetical protein
VPSLEQIVRPFVVVDVTPGVSVPASSGASASQAPLVMRIGYGGKAKTVTTSWSTSFSGYMDGKQKETKPATSS